MLLTRILGSFAAIGLLFCAIQCMRAETQGESLFSAAQAGDTAKVKALLDQGADPDFRFDGDSTALSQAVDNDDLPMASLLLERKAKPNLLVHDHTALDDAKSADMKKLLRDHGAKHSRDR